MKHHAAQSLRLIVLLTLITGILYPLSMTLLTELLFPYASTGSPVAHRGGIVGSSLVGQKFESERYFHSRPSAIEYQPVPSGGSNLGPTSSKLHELVTERRNAFVRGNLLDSSTAVPSDMLFASGSGIDPHISPQSALMQIRRVSAARGIDSTKLNDVRRIVESCVEESQYMIFGERRINVLRLNLLMDEKF